VSQLIWRIEFNGEGPFVNEESFTKIQNTILKEVGGADRFHTTFLNLYTQRVDPPYIRKAFKHLFDKETALPIDKDVKFGFPSKEVMEDSLCINLEEYPYRSIYYTQFATLFRELKGFCVKVYLANPLAQATEEIAFKFSEALLVETASTIEQYNQL